MQVASDVPDLSGGFPWLGELKNIDVRGELFYEESFIRNAIQRYEHLWIPLVHKLISEDNSVDEFDLAPPLGKKIFVSVLTICLKYKKYSF